jgi:hypothetical protein
MALVHQLRHLRIAIMYDASNRLPSTFSLAGQPTDPTHAMFRVISPAHKECEWWIVGELIHDSTKWGDECLPCCWIGCWSSRQEEKKCRQTAARWTRYLSGEKWKGRSSPSWNSVASGSLPMPSPLCLYLLSAGFSRWERGACVWTCNRTDPIAPSFFRRLSLSLSFSQCINTSGGFHSTAEAPPSRSRWLRSRFTPLSTAFSGTLSGWSLN